MTRPGVSITSIAVRPRRSAPVETGTAFFVGATATGTAGTAVKVTSFPEYTATFGGRTGPAAFMSDSAELFFAEGGGDLWVVPTSAEVTVYDALEALPGDLGPGQVAAPGDTTVHADLLAHAETHNRTALLDAALDADAAALTAMGGGLNSEYGGLFAGWPTIAAASGGDTPRDVPPSALVAGLLARADRAGGLTPAEPPAGDRGYSRRAIGVSGPVFTDTERTTLTLAGVNTVRVGLDGVQLYGFRSTSNLPEWAQLTAQRIRMILIARLRSRAEQFLFRPIDGKGLLLAEFRGTLAGELDRLYQGGSLYGETAEDAYDVEVGPSVNTDETIAAGELHAVALARVSRFAEMIAIDIVFTDDIAA